MKTTKILGTVFALFLITAFFISSGVAVPAAGSTVYVYEYGATGDMISTAYYHYENEVVTGVVMTDDTGTFTFEGITEGIYDIVPTGPTAGAFTLKYPAVTLGAYKAGTGTSIDDTIINESQLIDFIVTGTNGIPYGLRFTTPAGGVTYAFGKDSLTGTQLTFADSTVFPASQLHGINISDVEHGTWKVTVSLKTGYVQGRMTPTTPAKYLSSNTITFTVGLSPVDSITIDKETITRGDSVLITITGEPDTVVPVTIDALGFVDLAAQSGISGQVYDATTGYLTSFTATLSSSGTRTLQLDTNSSSNNATYSITATFPSSTQTAVVVVSTETYSGCCGDNLTWTLDTDTGVLEITGSGDMTDYNAGGAGWYQYRDTITSVSLSSGLTSIGEWAFYNCTSLTSVVIPDSVTSIGWYAFSDCTSLPSVVLPDSVTSIGWSAFSDCSSLTSIVIPDGVTSIEGWAFSGCSSLTSIDIPDSVTSIGDYPFRGCISLTSIDIPDSVTSIGWYAFSDCTSLTSIVIPDGVTSISYGTFSGCSSLTSIVIPDGVTSIGGWAFSVCRSLTSVTIGNSVTSIGEGAFYGCWSLTSIVIPDSVTSIGDRAFEGCSSLTSIDIPDSVTSIGNSTFCYCRSLTYLVIPAGVTSIGDDAFSGCSSLTSIIIPDNVTSIGQSAFFGCSSLTSIIIPDNVTSIGQSAFFGCSSLTSIVIPDGVTSIGELAFYGCSSLTSVVLPDSVTSIGDDAFSSCTNLEVVDLSGTTVLSSVGDNAFGSTHYNAMKSGSVIYVSDERTAALFIAGTNYYAPNTRIIVNGTVPEITYIIQFDANGGTGTMANQTFTYNQTQNLSNNTFVKNAGVFSGWATTADGPVVYTDGQSVVNLLKTDGASLTLYAVWTPVTGVTYSGTCGDNLTWKLTTATGVLEIDGTGDMTDYLYSYNQRPDWYQYRDTITTVSLSSGVTSIGESAFFDCGSLTSISIPDSVTSIGERAFSGCTSLTSVVIPNNVTSIGEYAFSNCNSLKNVTIGNGVTTIGEGAFWDCSSLTSVVIPENVTSIGDSVFQWCYNLTNIVFPDSVVTLGNYTVFGCRSLTSVVIPENVTSIGAYTFSGCSSLTSIILPEKVTSIGENAFSGCHSLISITIPTGVTSIGNETFAGCFSLPSIILHDNITFIGDAAFRDCHSLKNVTIPYGVTSIGDLTFNYCSDLEVVDLSDTTILSSVGDYAFGCGSYDAMKSGSVIYVSDERTAALFIDGTNYYAPHTRIIVNGTIPEITYIIQFDANGGTGTMANQTFTYNTTQNLSSNTFVKNASVFSGWATTADGPVIYTDGQSVVNLLNTNNSTLILYAVWTPDENPTAPDFSLPLTTGWNFISVPKTLNASNNTAGSLFGSVDTSDKNILGYNTQTGTWVPLAIADVIQPLNGYWIYAAAETAINLTYPSTPTLPAAKTLYPGWNAVGLSSLDKTPAQTALVGTSWRVLIPWNLEGGMYDQAIVNGGSDANSPSRFMTPGNGYWVYVDAESTLLGLTA